MPSILLLTSLLLTSLLLTSLDCVVESSSREVLKQATPGSNHSLVALQFKASDRPGIVSNPYLSGKYFPYPDLCPSSISPSSSSTSISFNLSSSCSSPIFPQPHLRSLLLNLLHSRSSYICLRVLARPFEQSQNSAPVLMMSASKESRRIPQTGPAATKYGKRAGGYVFLESDDDSDSDYDTRGHGGGAKLNQSPYRPPHVRKSRDQLALAQGQKMVTPDSTDSEVVVQKLAQLSFQQGDPVPGHAAADVFDTHSTTSSASDAVVATQDKNTSSVNDAASGTPKAPAPTQTGDMQVSGRKLKFPASDRHLVGDVDAQHLYPHTACVFIANLPQQMSDQALEAEITERFNEYGTIFVKIKRDRNDMPFGFIQYTNEADAMTAVKEGLGKQIFDRPCRVEIANGNRTFLVMRRDGLDTTIDEAIPVVAGYGMVSHAAPLDLQTAESIEVYNAIYVEFEEFDCERDLVNRFARHPVYRVAAFDYTKSFSNRNDDTKYLTSCTINRKSIFVHGLPSTVTEDQLRKIFTRHDLKVVAVAKPKPTFAFVEFERPDMPDIALAQLLGTYALGFRLNFERRRAPRRVTSKFRRDIQATPGRSVTPARSLGRAITPGRSLGRGLTQSGNRGDGMTDRRAFSANPAAAYLAAQAGVEPDALLTDPAPRVVVSPGTMTSAAAGMGQTGDFTTAGGAGTAGSTQLSALAPSFGPQGYFPPGAAASTPITGGFPNVYNGYVGGQFGFQQPGFGTMIPFAQQPGFVGNSMVQPAFSGFVRDGQMYCQDHNSGMIFSVPQMTIGPMGTQPVAINRSASAVPSVPASDHPVQRRSQTSIRTKKSVTFADPLVVDDAESSLKEETDKPTDAGEQDATSADEGGA
ncbi:hypothetical protein GE09DRAFT_1057638 [Coniochaeta sp. 2T2.1]|nr:hypothetical protein GE09DRAFT_1057638 [Coniochaeta sp. 2T2.1]